MVARRVPWKAPADKELETRLPAMASIHAAQDRLEISLEALGKVHTSFRDRIVDALPIVDHFVSLLAGEFPIRPTHRTRHVLT